jgi:predicted alpha/beta-hydrolase family hydrolase
MLGLINEIAGMWKEAGVTSLRYNPSIYMERRKKRTRKDPGRTAGLQVKISTWELQNAPQSFYSQTVTGS